MTISHTERDLHVDVDLSVLIKNFGAVFSGEQIWIRELLQNARRAKASRIDLFTNPSDPRYLRIEDDGCGIPDFQTLLTLGGSGWAADVIEKENPFGLGFYAALYAADRVEIRSNHQGLLIETGKVLAGERIRTEPVQTPRGTTLILALKKPLGKPADPKPDAIHSLFKEIVEGFPVPVTLDGVELPRPYALDVWERLRFELPEGVALAELDPSDRFSLHHGITFLQGLGISHARHRSYPWSNFSRRGMRVYMHLHADQWRVRVPDRNTLYESTETSEKIERLERALKEAAVRHIVGRGEAGKYFDTLLAWGCHAPIRALPIPKGRWSRLTASPHLPHYDCEEIDYAIGPLEEKKIPTPENALRFIRDGMGIRSDDDTIDHLFAAYLFEIPILDSWNDPEHWFSKTPSGEPVDAFYDREISVSVRDEDRVAEGEWWGKKVVLCKRFSLTLEGYGTKEVTEDAFIDGAFWILDQALHDDYPIDQAFTFQTESEDFDEASFENAMESFRARIAILKGDLRGLIASAISPYSEVLEGRRFTVAAENGKISVAQEA